MISKIKGNKMKRNFFKFDFCCENYPPTRHRKSKMIDFAPSKKSVISKKFHVTYLEQFPRLIKSPLSR